MLPYLLGLLADVHSRAGEDIEALKVIQDGLAVADTTGEHFNDARVSKAARGDSGTLSERP
jgi:hypothetical protein